MLRPGGSGPRRRRDATRGLAPSGAAVVEARRRGGAVDIAPSTGWYRRRRVFGIIRYYKAPFCRSLWS